MKKLYAILAALAVTFSMSAADWYLVGAKYGWSDNANYKFSDNGNGTQTLFVSALAGEIKIKEAGTWSTSFGSNGSKLKEGVEYAAGTDTQNIAVDGTIDNAVITINPDAHTIIVKGQSKENEYTDVYIIGDFGSGWSEDIANGFVLNPVAGKDNEFHGKAVLNGEKNYIKFKAGELVYGTGGDDIIAEIGEIYNMSQAGNAFVVAAGDYEFTVYLDKNAEQGFFTFSGQGGTIEPDPDYVSIAGFFNDWNKDANKTADIVDFCATIVVENYVNGEGDGAGFKVVYGSTWYGGADAINNEWVTLDTASDAANISLPEAEGKTVTFVFATDTGSLKVSYDSTGVEGIEVDNAAPVYYNLQGVRVNNPENGVFIVVRGDKVSKKIIR